MTSYKRTRFPGTKVFDCFSFGVSAIFIATKHIYVTVSRPIFGYVIYRKKSFNQWRKVDIRCLDVQRSINSPRFSLPYTRSTVHQLQASALNLTPWIFLRMVATKNKRNLNKFSIIFHFPIPCTSHLHSGQNTILVKIGLSCMKIPAHVNLRPTHPPPPLPPSPAFPYGPRVIRPFHF